MVNTRRIPVAPSTSSVLPQDLITVDPDVHVPTTTGILMNTTDVMWSILPSREDPTLTPPTEGKTLEEQPLGTTTEIFPQYYAGDTGLGVGEPHVDLGEDLKFVRLRETVCQASQIEEPCATNCDGFV
uniref:Uncharacterized protein n=1 Tax=Cannabis sativa TaxID=3483 RepID=A0A803Q135_CANSA